MCDPATLFSFSCLFASFFFFFFFSSQFSVVSPSPPLKRERQTKEAAARLLLTAAARCVCVFVCVWGAGIPPFTLPQNLGAARCGFNLAGTLQTCHQFFFPKGKRVPAPRLSALLFCLGGLTFFFFLFACSFFNLINFLISFIF